MMHAANFFGGLAGDGPVERAAEGLQIRLPQQALPADQPEAVRPRQPGVPAHRRAARPDRVHRG
jgi:hypothetical protein